MEEVKWMTLNLDTYDDYLDKELDTWNKNSPSPGRKQNGNF